MFLSGIEYPNQILDAIKSGSLVVFAGAGASMGAPTNLPSFEQLCNQIAEGTSFERNGEACEVFLGTLKAKDIPVNETAAKILSDSCKTHNAEHKAIVNLFLNPQDIKIVTTNYDQMFEQVTSGFNISVYDSPALPLGSDFAGIVHIHGNVNCSRYMVVTDEDFGKAYLTDGYASRFLTQLLDSYTVIFIGYSYNDTIVKYLTRAMAREHKQNRYVLTDNNAQSWSDLGIQPIIFPKNAFSKMVESLEKLGERAKRSLLEWKAYLNEIAKNPPRDQTVGSEVEYCLESTERAQILANCIEGNTSWIDYLDKQSVFDNLFSNHSNIINSNFDLIWADWLCNKVVGKEDVLFFKLLFKHSNVVSAKLAEKILWRLEENSFPIDNIGEYIVLCEKFFQSPHQVYRLIERCYENEQLHLSELLYKKYWEIEITPVRKYWLNEDVVYSHKFWGETWVTRESWKQCQWGTNKDYSKEFLSFFKAKLDELIFKYKCISSSADAVEPWDLYMHVIEDREENYHEEMVDCLVEQMQELCQTVESFDADFLRGYIIEGLQSQSIFSRKIFLKLLRETNVFTADESFDLFEKGDYFNFKVGKEQVFLLIKKVFVDLSEERKDQIVDHIEKITPREDDNEYEKYNWCVWIESFCPANTRISTMKKDILSRHNYEPRPHPELDMYMSSCSWGSDRSPYSAEELKAFGFERAYETVLEYKDDNWVEVNRYGLLEAFSKVIRDDYSWAFQISSLLNNRDADKDLWECCFRGFQSESFTVIESIELIEALIQGRNSVMYSSEIAMLIWKTVQRESFKKEYQKYEGQMFEQIEKVWSTRTDEEVECQRVIDYTLNSTVGILLQSLIILISYNENNELRKEYKVFLENALLITGWERKIIICVIAGHFNFLFYRDKSWVVKYCEPMLRGKDEQDFAPAWEGIVWFSRSLNRDVADAMSKIYYEAVTHISLLTGEVRKGLLELYLTLLIYVISNPISKYVPRFYKYASLEDRVEFLKDIEHRLWNMEDSMQKQWWDSWLKRFFVNLKENNKPEKPADSELIVLLQCVVKMKSIFPEAVDIMTKGYLPQNVDDIIFYEMKENGNASLYPQSTAKLLISLLNAGNSFNHSVFSIRDVVKDLVGLSPKEQEGLDEALLKQNIQV